MHSFAELRESLGHLASGQIVPSTFRNLRSELGKLSELRQKIQVQPVQEWCNPVPEAAPIEIIDHTTFVAVTVEEKPVEVKYVSRPRTYQSAPSSSVSYNSERYLPYRILWAKVIVRATYDYALWRDSPDPRLKKFAEEAEKWLFEPSDLELSFENICFAFDFPIEKIRQKTRLLTRNDVKKLEFMDRHGRSDSGDTSGGNHR